MDNIIDLSKKICKKIRISSGCSYLYSYFNDLISLLEANKERPLSIEEKSALKCLISDYAKDSRFNNWGSANWMRYSARCFVCADALVCYLQEESDREYMITSLNEYFKELIEHRVAPIIQQDVLDKYIVINKEDLNEKELYVALISGALTECGRCRYWEEDDLSLAYAYTTSANRLIDVYLKETNDFTILKEVLPKLNTGGELSHAWCDDNEHHFWPRSERALSHIEKMLDKMLDIHLGLFNLWYWKDSQEVIDTLSVYALVETLELTDDDDFSKILNHAVTLPYNEKVEGILKHFAEDDEAWIVDLSHQLLKQYKV